MARIRKLRICGYRSIGEPIEIDFPTNTPVVLVGENNSGKSNIVRALNLVLGPFWPGNHDPEDHEFLGRQRDRTIEIVIEFDSGEPLGGRFEKVLWRYDPNSQELVYFRGIQSTGEERYVSNEDRDTCMCTVVEADRNLAWHLGYTSKWTMLSRLMHRFHRALQSQASVSSDLEDLFNQIKGKFHEVPEFQQFVDDLQKQMTDLIGSMTHSLAVDFEAYNPVNFFHALRLQAREGAEPRTLEEMGTGEQQILALAFAHAYAKAFHGGIVLVVEEPEAHLHPLAQQWLARRLKQQCEEGLQLVVTTHSPAFVDIESLEGLVLVSKVGGQTQVKQLTREELAHYCAQHGAPAVRVTSDNVLPFYATGATAEILAGFFAKVVVLVEGPTEELSLPIYFAKAGLDPAREGVAIVPVHGKGNLARWRRLFEAYGIPCYTVLDNDQKDDSDGAKRRDALRAIGLSDDDVDAVLSTTDWQVETEYTVFGADYETALKSHFPSYEQLEEGARAEGVDSKPFIARWVAEKMDMAPGNQGWDKIRQMVDVLRCKRPALSLGEPGG